MKVRNVLVGTVFCAATAFWNSSAYSQAKDEKKPAPAQPPATKPAEKPAAAPAGGMDPGMDAMMKAGQPGEFHAKLKAMEGNWDTTVKSYMSPGTPTESKGVSTRKWIMDGRFLQEDNTGDFMGMPFKGMGITGYDNIQKKYVSTWIDNMGTSIMNSTGTVDATGKTFTYECESPDPMTGKMTKTKMVTKIIDDKKHTFEMSGPGPDGKEMKMLEITYTKK